MEKRDQECSTIGSLTAEAFSLPADVISSHFARETYYDFINDLIVDETFRSDAVRQQGPIQALVKLFGEETVSLELRELASFAIWTISTNSTLQPLLLAACPDLLRVLVHGWCSGSRKLKKNAEGAIQSITGSALWQKALDLVKTTALTSTKSPKSSIRPSIAQSPLKSPLKSPSRRFSLIGDKPIASSPVRSLLTETSPKYETNAEAIYKQLTDLLEEKHQKRHKASTELKKRPLHRRPFREDLTVVATEDTDIKATVEEKEEEEDVDLVQQWNLPIPPPHPKPLPQFLPLAELDRTGGPAQEMFDEEMHHGTLQDKIFLAEQFLTQLRSTVPTSAGLEEKEIAAYHLWCMLLREPKSAEVNARLLSNNTNGIGVHFDNNNAAADVKSESGYSLTSVADSSYYSSAMPYTPSPMQRSTSSPGQRAPAQQPKTFSFADPAADSKMGQVSVQDDVTTNVGTGYVSENIVPGSLSGTLSRQGIPQSQQTINHRGQPDLHRPALTDVLSPFQPPNHPTTVSYSQQDYLTSPTWDNPPTSDLQPQALPTVNRRDDQLQRNPPSLRAFLLKAGAIETLITLLTELDEDTHAEGALDELTQLHTRQNSSRPMNPSQSTRASADHVGVRKSVRISSSHDNNRSGRIRSSSSSVVSMRSAGSRAFPSSNSSVYSSRSVGGMRGVGQGGGMSSLTGGAKRLRDNLAGALWVLLQPLPHRVYRFTRTLHHRLTMRKSYRELNVGEIGVDFDSEAGMLEIRSLDRVYCFDLLEILAYREDEEDALAYSALAEEVEANNQQYVLDGATQMHDIAEGSVEDEDEEVHTYYESFDTGDSKGAPLTSSPSAVINTRAPFFPPSNIDVQAEEPIPLLPFTSSPFAVSEIEFDDKSASSAVTAATSESVGDRRRLSFVKSMSALSQAKKLMQQHHHQQLRPPLQEEDSNSSPPKALKDDRIVLIDGALESVDETTPLFLQTEEAVDMRVTEEVLPSYADLLWTYSSEEPL